MKLKNATAVIFSVLLLGSTVGYAFTGSGLAAESTDSMQASIPETYDEALKLIEDASDEGTSSGSKESMPPYHGRDRFILWTHDGKNVMWGQFGNGFFVGEDNNGKQAWGIYYKGTFMGFYDGEQFAGRYWGYGRMLAWKAEGLFGLDGTWGGGMTFPVYRPAVLERRIQITQAEPVNSAEGGEGVAQDTSPATLSLGSGPTPIARSAVHKTARVSAVQATAGGAAGAQAGGDAF
jgi:hypothetical protein